MSGQILALFGVSLAAALGDYLIPESGHEGTRRFLRFLTALVVLVLLLRPFLSFLGGAEGFFQGEVPEIGESTEDFEGKLAEAVANRAAEQLEQGVAGWVAQEFGVREEHVSVSAFFTSKGEVHRVLVILSGAALLQDPDEIERRLFELLNCEVEVR